MDPDYSLLDTIGYFFRFTFLNSISPGSIFMFEWAINIYSRLNLICNTAFTSLIS